MKREGCMEFNTRLLHGDSVKPYADGATLPQISQVSAFQYNSAEQQEAVFQHRATGFAYTRVANPTVAAFEQRINELEGGNAAIACSSGMSAITLALLNMLCTGDEIITSRGIYGGTIDLLEDLEKFGIATRYVDHLTPEEIAQVYNERTRVIFGELIGNPSLEILNVEAVASYAHDHGVPLIVDATTATPYIARPISMGADIVIHSTTKYINGSGNAVSGIIVDSAKFKWDFEKFRAFSGYKKYGPYAYTIRLRTDIWENMGGCMAPVSAYLNTIGLETLGIRMERIISNAEKLAYALRGIEGITVNYPKFDDHPQRALVDSELGGNGGGILTFRVGSKEKAYRILNRLKYAIRATSLGDVRTLVIYPASTLYVRRTKEEMEASGVYDDLIRVSVGIEDINDLIEDFTQAIRDDE